jgi:hypothetical protein
MARYEFSFVVTDIDLADDHRQRIGRAIALAGAAELGTALPPDAIAAPVTSNDLLIRHWVGFPDSLRLPDAVREFGGE